MREGVGVHGAAGARLEPVVAHRLRRRDGLLHVAALEVAGLVDRVGPHAGVAVGLQLEAHRQVVGLVGILALELAHLAARAGLVLHVVAHLVRDHVGPGEVAGRAELALHVAVEGQVEVDALVGGAVERTDGGAGVPAAGGHGVAVEHHLGALIALARALERGGPGVLGIGEDVGAEVAQVALGVLSRGDAGGVGGRGRLAGEARVHAEPGHAAAAAAAQQGDQEDDDHAHHARAAADPAHRQARARAHSAPARVDHVTATAAAFPAHSLHIPSEMWFVRRESGNQGCVNEVGGPDVHRYRHHRPDSHRRSAAGVRLLDKSRAARPQGTQRARRSRASRRLTARRHFARAFFVRLAAQPRLAFFFFRLRACRDAAGVLAELGRRRGAAAPPATPPGALAAIQPLSVLSATRA